MKLSIPVVMMLALSACSRLTVENYDKLKEGMTYEEVTNLIGKPTECTEALMIRHCEWRDGERTVSVSFLGGKATLFAAEKIN